MGFSKTTSFGLHQRVVVLFLPVLLMWLCLYLHKTVVDYVVIISAVYLWKWNAILFSLRRTISFIIPTLLCRTVVCWQYIIYCLNCNTDKCCLSCLRGEKCFHSSKLCGSSSITFLSCCYFKAQSWNLQLNRVNHINN